MAKKKNEVSEVKIPNLYDARRNVIKGQDELEYGLRGVVRILSRNKGRSSYFIQEFEAKFASELNEVVPYEKTFVDHENLKVIIKLPDPPNEHEKEIIRHAIVKDYTLGVDDLRTRAGLIAWEGMDESTKRKLIEAEKNMAKS